MESIGQVNKYVCEKCHAVHGTINLNTGITPFVIGCRNEGCGGGARSMLYNLPRGKTGCGWAFYRPTQAEFVRLDFETQFAILSGQLMLGELNQALPLNEPDHVYEIIRSADIDRWLGYIASAYDPHREIFDKVAMRLKPSYLSEGN